MSACPPRAGIAAMAFYRRSNDHIHALPEPRCPFGAIADLRCAAFTVAVTLNATSLDDLFSAAVGRPCCNG
jgi:hypothetical protein